MIRYLTLLVMVHAQELLPIEEKLLPPLPPREAALEKLLSTRESQEEFDKACAEAKTHNFPAQTILEARFLYLVDKKDNKALAALVPELEKQLPTFSTDNTEIFAVKEDFLAVIEFTKAIAALEKNDPDAFKKHITEAFWLSPSQASAYTPYIDKLRVQTQSASTTIDLATSLRPLQADGKTLTLQQQLAENDALLLHFWSPWSTDCATTFSLLDEFTKKQFASKKIAISSLLVDEKTDIMADAKEFLKTAESPVPGAQFIDNATKSLASQLRVTLIPTIVILSPKGRILYHGSASDPDLNKALEAIKNKE